MNHSLTWLLVADASSAKVYSLHKAKLFKEHTENGLLNLISNFSHEESRLKAAELTADKKGEFGPNTYGDNNPKEVEAEIFAHELADYVNQGRLTSEFRDLIIIAPPTFMGLLRKKLHGAVTKVISKQIEKDYTKENIKSLTDKLTQQL